MRASAVCILERNTDSVRRQTSPPTSGKAEVRIYDYVDRDVPTLARMFEKRLRGYRAIGYSTEIAYAP